MNQELNNELIICVGCEDEFEELYDSAYCYDCYSQRDRIFRNDDDDDEEDEGNDDDDDEEDEGNDADDENEIDENDETDKDEIENMIEELLTDITEYECVVMDIE